MAALQHLSAEQLAVLSEGLNFFHVAELKEICAQLNLQEQGKKAVLIQHILHFIQTGEKQELPKIPHISRAKRGENYPLHPETLILKGAYKNDLKTRLFFKKLIGEYFHFTAFGVDWLNDRWMVGQPPTYREFAEMWKAEYTLRQNAPRAPKMEWAYINFTQRFLAAHPHSSRADLLSAWTQERGQQKIKAEKILAPFLKPHK